MRSNNPTHRMTRDRFLHDNNFDEEEDPDDDYDNLYISDIGGMMTLIPP